MSMAGIHGLANATPIRAETRYGLGCPTLNNLAATKLREWDANRRPCGQEDVPKKAGYRVIYRPGEQYFLSKITELS